MKTNTGAAKPASGKLAGGLLASGPFFHTRQAETAQRQVGAIAHEKHAVRPHPMELLNARTIRADRRRELKGTAVFWLKIVATLAAMQIANLIQKAAKETLK